MSSTSADGRARRSSTIPVPRPIVAANLDKGTPGARRVRRATGEKIRKPPSCRCVAGVRFGACAAVVGAQSVGGHASDVQNLATGDATVVLEGTITSVGASKQTF